MMKTSLRSRCLLLVALGALSILSACTGNTIQHSGGTPVNPETDPGGQGMPGSRSTGANARGTPGRP